MSRVALELLEKERNMDKAKLALKSEQEALESEREKLALNAEKGGKKLAADREQLAAEAAAREAGVQDHYTPYSARHASTSAAARVNIPIQDILNSAGWTRESTFGRFYNRPLYVPPVDTPVTDFLPAIMQPRPSE